MTIKRVAGGSAGCGNGCLPNFVRQVLDGASADLALVDPPYNLAKESAKITFSDRKAMVGSDRQWDDVFNFWDGLMVPLLNTLVEFNKGVIAVWASDWWISDIKRHLRETHGFRMWPTYHWCKTNPAFPVRKANPTSAVEYLVIGSLPNSYFDLTALDGHKNWVARPVVSQSERLKTVNDKGESVDVNPTQKPLDLTRTLIRALCPPGGLVLDTCGGTGTTAVAAAMEGRRFAYVESDPVQFAAAGRRFRSINPER